MGGGLALQVCHFPPGASKWNKVEHRLFSFISSNWRGEPLRDYETIVRLIAKTTTAKGLTVTCRLDRRRLSGRQKGVDRRDRHRQSDCGTRFTATGTMSFVRDSSWKYY